MSVTEQDVMRALSRIEDPDLHRDIVSLGFVQKPEIGDGVVSVPSNCAASETESASGRPPRCNVTSRSASRSCVPR